MSVVIDSRINEFLKKIQSIVDLLDGTKNYVTNSYKANKYNFYDLNVTVSWVDSIIYYMENFFKESYNNIKKRIEDEKNLLYNKTKQKSQVKEAKYNQSLTEPNNNTNSTIVNEKLDVFTSKDIQKLNNDIIIEFTQFSANFVKDDDVRENQTLGSRLFQVANISRNSYNDSNQILSILYKDFEKEKDKTIIISSPDIFRKSFSNWVKTPKNWLLAKQYFDNYAKKFNPTFLKEEHKVFKNYYIKLYKDLLILYFLCEVSFPLVEIDFEIDTENNNFDSRTMIDNFQIGHKAKVNFVYFPSLFSNANYLENGRQWVFNYIYTDKKCTFFFDEKQLSKLTPLLEEEKIFRIPKVSEKLKFELKKEIHIIPKPNYPLSENVNKEFIFHIINKNTKKVETFKVKNNFKLKDDEEIIKFEMILMKESVYEIEFKK